MMINEDGERGGVWDWTNECPGVFLVCIEEKKNYTQVVVVWEKIYKTDAPNKDIYATAKLWKLWKCAISLSKFYNGIVFWV